MLLTSIVVAWSTAAIEQVIKSALTNRLEEHVHHIAPIIYVHINLRGVNTFDLEKHRVASFAENKVRKREA